jgi:hypothetical protein
MSAAWGQTNTGQLNNTLINTGTVSTSGSNARATSILGGSGTINNSGTLSTTGASSNAAFLQGNNDQLINSGKIIVTGASSDAVFSNTVGSSFTATIKNLAGGQIISQNGSAIRTLNGNTTIINAGLVQSNAGTAITMGERPFHFAEHPYRVGDQIRIAILLSFYHHLEARWPFNRQIGWHCSF